MIIRHRQERDFTALPNALLQDGRLHVFDVGLLGYMLSLPPDWSFSIRGLAAILPHDGVAAIGKSLQRIEAAGYLQRKQKRGADGKLSSFVWVVSDQPNIDFPNTEKPNEKPNTEKLYTGNRAQSKITSKQDYNNKQHMKERGDRRAGDSGIRRKTPREIADGDAWDALICR